MLLKEMLLDENGCLVAKISPTEAIRLLATRKHSTPILDLRGIPFEILPKEIAMINGLEELYLGSNGLSELPECIGHIEDLRILSLGKNSFFCLPRSLVERWATLQKLFLGSNQITELSFPEEELWAFQHGSIGRNPIEEPIGRCWMIREDALKIPALMRELVPANLSKKIAKLLAEQAIHIFAQSGEPMIYEILFEGMTLTEEGTIIWNDYFDRPWLRYVGVALLPSITRGSMVDSSFWLWNLQKLCISDLPEIPPSIQTMVNLSLVGRVQG